MTCHWNWLFAFFGIGAWLEVNAIFAEYWTLSQVVPEGAKIMSTLTLVIQISNIIPIIVSRWNVDVRKAIITILVGGFASLVLMAATWHYTVSISGSSISLFVYMWTFCAASFDCLSNLFVWAYSARYVGGATVSMAVGQSFASSITYTLALLQGYLMFSVGTYFSFIALVAVGNLMAFLFIKPPIEAEDDTSPRIECECEPQPVNRWFAALTGLSFVQNGLMPAIVYFASPANSFYNQILPGLVTPLSSMLAFKFKAAPLIFVCCGISAVMGLATVVLALVRCMDEHNKTKYWWDDALFTPLVFVGINCLAYTKSAILSRLPTDANWSCTDLLMKRAGVFIQVGSFTGAVTSFLLVRVL